MPELNTLTLTDHLVSGEEFGLVWNAEYQCYQTEPIPKSLEKYYESAAYISHSDSADTFMERIYQRAKKINLDRKLGLVKRFCGQEGVLMDIGAGTGDFVKHAQERGWEAYGVEPNEAARGRAHNKGVPVYSRITVQQEAIYDAITLWHVLEHLPDLDEEIKTMSDRLKPGGWLIVAVPNYKSLDAKYYKSNWAAYDVPRHLWHFSRGSIKRLFEQKGYELRAVKPLWLDAFYISWLSETYRKNRLAPLSGALMGTASNLYGVFSREFSSQVYCLQKKAE